MHGLGLDDAYHVVRVLADRPDGITELVTLDGTGPFVRRRIPSKLARRSVWAKLAESDCFRLPHVEATYELPDEYVVIYDYVSGETLEQRIDSKGRMSETEAASVAADVCEAASSLHALGIIHRDISPTNVVLAADGAHLIDFGIAREMRDNAPRDTTPLGTWGFASPEQYGFAQTDARSDVFSIGRLFAYLLTGTRPDTESFHRLLVENGVSSQAIAVAEQACAFEPSERFQSTSELRSALLALADPDRRACFGGVSGDRSLHQKKHDPRQSSTHLKSSAQVRDSNDSNAAPQKKGLRIMAIVLIVSLFVIVAAIISGAVVKSQDADLPVGTNEIGSNGMATASASSEDSSIEAADAIAESPSASESGANSSSVYSPEDSSSASAGMESYDARTGINAGSKVAGLEIAESAWWATANNTIEIIFSVKNSTDGSLSFPRISYTGRLDNGAVVLADSTVLPSVGPGETVYCCVERPNDTDIVPDEMEFSIVNKSEYISESSIAQWNVSVTNLNVLATGNSKKAITGEVALDSTGSDLIAGRNQIHVVAVLRDGDGSIVGGGSELVSMPDVGESTAFSINVSSSPDFASYEVHAHAL
jgi:serine/threonine protein kinase